MAFGDGKEKVVAYLYDINGNALIYDSTNKVPVSLYGKGDTVLAGAGTAL